MNPIRAVCMTYLVALVVFECCYMVAYLLPFVAVLQFGIMLEHYLGDRLLPYMPIIEIAIIPFGVLAILAFLVAGWRAKLAADAYGERDMPMWEAHQVSKVLFRGYLSFLPVVGWLFQRRS